MAQQMSQTRREGKGQALSPRPLLTGRSTDEGWMSKGAGRMGASGAREERVTKQSAETLDLVDKDAFQKHHRHTTKK